MRVIEALNRFTDFTFIASQELFNHIFSDGNNENYGKKKFLMFLNCGRSLPVFYSVLNAEDQKKLIDYFEMMKSGEGPSWLAPISSGHLYFLLLTNPKDLEKKIEVISKQFYNMQLNIHQIKKYIERCNQEKHDNSLGNFTDGFNPGRYSDPDLKVEVCYEFKGSKNHILGIYRNGVCVLDIMDQADVKMLQNKINELSTIIL